MIFTRVTFTLILLSFFCIYTTSAKGEFYELVGEKAPDFSLKSSDNNLYTLSDYIGKIVVLEWLNPKCPISNLRYDNGLTQARQNKHVSDGVVWLTVSSTAVGKLGYMEDVAADKLQRSWGNEQVALLLDRTGKLAADYKVEKVPHVVIIDQAGFIVYMGAMDEVVQGRDENGALLVVEKINYVDQVIEALQQDKSVPTVYQEPVGCNIKR